MPLQAVYSGARDSQLILFTFYSLRDFRVCMCAYSAVCAYREAVAIAQKTEGFFTSEEQMREGEGEGGAD